METDTLSAIAELLKGQRISASEPLRSSQEQPDDKKSQPTLFDICSQDRHRVLQLIEELVDAQDQVDKLKQKLEEDKNNFREKRSALLKKLDLLGEKHEKALSDIQRLKERHLHSLTTLEEKVSTISQKFEASVAEGVQLRKTNAELQRENLALRKLSAEATHQISAIQSENSKLSVMVDTNRTRQKAYKKELKKLSLEVIASSNRAREISNASSIPQFGNVLTEYGRDKHPGDSKPSSTFTGAGDFVNTENCQLLKPPTQGELGRNTMSSITVANATTTAPTPVSFIQPGSYQILSSSNDSSDIAMLENLFFRF